MMDNAPETLTGFQAWYAEYPRKIARKAAEKAWKALNPDAETQQAMHDTLVWQRPLWKDPKFIPYPATYLRGERWTDEAPQTVSHTVQKASPDDIALGKAIREHHAQLAQDRAAAYQAARPWMKVH